MESISLYDLQLAMTVTTFMLGFIAFGIGVIILAVGTFGKDIKAIATQTTKLAQKGIAEEISGLVGNASNLLNAINGLVHTRAGIGVFLTITGIIMMGSSYWLILNIQ